MSREKPSSNDCHHFFVLVVSPLLVLMEDQWKALNEKGVAVSYVGTKSVISPEIVCISNFYIYPIQRWFFSAHPLGNHESLFLGTAPHSIHSNGAVSPVRF